MENNIGYSLGLVEGYLERLVLEGQEGAETALEHFRNVEKNYMEVSVSLRKSKQTIDEIQLNLNGWRKI